jgi:tRNA wybutosine-synthesizing protein 2
MRARKVTRGDLPEIRDAEWVDSSRSMFVEGDDIWVPVKSGESFDAEIPERIPYTGRGWYMVGDVALIHGRKPAPDEIDAIIRFRRPRGIVWIAELGGVTRTPATELLWGVAGEIRHRENGLTFIMDPQQVMFSMGNRNEKTRVAGLVRAGPGGERVADMFAGIGYFSLPLAAAGAQVHAMEINPVAFGYLERNIRENRLSAKIIATPGDCRASLAGTYSRIVMGHFEAVGMLPDALAHATTGTVLHLHSISPVEDAIRAAAEGAGFSATIRVHKVKKYRPHVWHVVQDVTLS